jgi:hypothetical protein
MAAPALSGVVLAIAGVSLASIPDSNGVIHACVSKATGVVRIIDTSKSGSLGGCITGGLRAETPVTWSQTGRPGTHGASGCLQEPGRDLVEDLPIDQLPDGAALYA